MKARAWITSTVVALIYLPLSLYTRYHVADLLFGFPFELVPGIQESITSKILNALFWAAVTWFAVARFNRERQKNAERLSISGSRMKELPWIISALVALLYVPVSSYYRYNIWEFLFDFPFGYIPVLNGIGLSSILNALFWGALTWFGFARHDRKQGRKPEQIKTWRAVVSVGLVVALAGGLVWYPFFRPLIQFDHLEQNARKVITAAELQNWATNLMAKYPEVSNVTYAELGTNVLPQLKGLAPKMGPRVYIYYSEHPDVQSYVSLMWGSGFAGHAGFEIGPTNFTGQRGTTMWAPGVYFWHENRRQ